MVPRFHFLKQASMSIFTLPSKIAVKSSNHKEQGYVSFKASADIEKFTVILGGESSIFSSTVPIGVSKACINNKYVNITFHFTNRHWQKNVDDDFLVSGSEPSVEDTSNPACTLFEPIKVDDNGTFYLTHVQSNGKYLKAFSHGKNYLQFSSVGGDEFDVGHTVTQLPDGHVRLNSDQFGKFWKRGSTSLGWIYAESSDTDTDAVDNTSLFWPVKVDVYDDIVALRNEGNGKFVKRFTAGGLTNCLSAATPTVEVEAKLHVKELVAERKVSGVVYLLQYARIYQHRPHEAGCTIVTNEGDEEASVDFEITYRENRWYTIGRTTYTVGEGIPTTMEAGVPFVKSAGEVSVGDVITFPPVVWHRTDGLPSTWITVRGSVTVPAKSWGEVSYKGKKVNCKVPFNYHQRDKSSIDGKIIESDQFDGFYDGVNSYDFKFELGTTQPLSH